MGVVLTFTPRPNYAHGAVEVLPIGIVKDVTWWSRHCGLRSARAGDKIYVPTSEARFLLNQFYAYNRG